MNHRLRCQVTDDAGVRQAGDGEPGVRFAHRRGHRANVCRAVGGTADHFRAHLVYVTHIYLVHALAVAAGVAQGYPASAMRTVSRLLPEGYGFGLPVIYLVWLGVVALLYSPCRRYAALKARSRAWWLSYL